MDHISGRILHRISHKVCRLRARALIEEVPRFVVALPGVVVDDSGEFLFLGGRLGFWSVFMQERCVLTVSRLTLSSIFFLGLSKD